MGRLQLQTVLDEVVGEGNRAWFQPPDNLTMTYPCIRYELDAENVVHADNVPYRRTPRYQITVIDEDPDSEIRDRVADLPMCIFERFYTANNLNHFVYNIFFD